MRSLKRGVDLLLAGYVALLGILAVPMLFGVRIYSVLSGSMAPAIPAGAAVYVCPEKFGSIRVGDIITFRVGDGDMTVTHRVVEKREDVQEFVTKGDANEQEDGQSVKFSQVAGTVRLALPYLGYPALLLESPGEKTLLLGLLIWLFFAQNILSGVIKSERGGVDLL